MRTIYCHHAQSEFLERRLRSHEPFNQHSFHRKFYELCLAHEHCVLFQQTQAVQRCEPSKDSLAKLVWSQGSVGCHGKVVNWPTASLGLLLDGMIHLSAFAG